MKHLTKWMVSSALTSAIVIAPATHSTIDAAETDITELVYAYDGKEFTVSYEQFTNALIDSEGGLYDFMMNEQPTIKGVGIANGSYVKYDSFASAVFDNPEENPLALLGDLSVESNHTLDSSVVDSYEEVTNFEGGLPHFEDVEAVVPEVISIH